MKSGIKKALSIKTLMIVFILLAAMVLSGFLISGRSAGIVGGFFGTTVDSDKANDIKRVSLVDREDLKLSYKETVNQHDLPVSERADKYGTYDIYVDDKQDQYLYLTDSNLYCGFFRQSSNSDMEDTAKNVAEIEARGIADAYVLKVLGEDQREYTFDEITYDEQGNRYYVKYVFHLDGVKTDDQCIIWVRASNGEVSACSMFNRGRYDSFIGENISTNETYARLETMQPVIKNNTNRYDMVDNFITMTDGGHLVMDYEMRNSELACTESYTVPVFQ